MIDNLVFELNFELPTDSVEFGFLPDASPSLAVGMYKLDEESGARCGKVAFVDPVNNKRVSEVELSGGLLDQKWVAPGLLVAVTSADISILTQKGIEKSLWLSKGLNLSVEIMNDSYLVSTSDGNIFQVPLQLDKVINSFKAHQMETWCVNKVAENVVATGADDFLLKLWDLRDPRDPIQVAKCHQAGVCSVATLNEKEFFTGSYDKQLRRFDLRNISKPLDILNFGSGVWRIKRKENHLLISGMNDGFHIVDIASWLKIWHYPSNSLAYGCSWDLQEKLWAGASFYDAKVYVWKERN